jgi:hypothetical protein
MVNRKMPQLSNSRRGVCQLLAARMMTAYLHNGHDGLRLASPKTQKFTLSTDSGYW